MILNAPYPADMRVKKETDALLKAGFNIFLLCLRKKDQAYEENYNGINITRIDGGKNNYELAFWDAVMSVSFRHPLFIKAIEKWVEEKQDRCLFMYMISHWRVARFPLEKNLN
jgi:hypothetical protein